MRLKDMLYAVRRQGVLERRALGWRERVASRQRRIDALNMQMQMWMAPHYHLVNAGTYDEHWVRTPSDAERAARKKQESH